MITRENYVKHLSEIIYNYSDYDLEGSCPSYNISLVEGFSSCCDACRDFVDLSLLECPACPCAELGAKKARQKAEEVIIDWKLGKHKWQKGESYYDKV